MAQPARDGKQGQWLDPASSLAAVGADRPAAANPCRAGQHAARRSDLDPRSLLGPSQTRRRLDRPEPDRPGQAKPGSKYHVAVDGDGVPVACVATAANVNDTVVFERLFLAAFAVMARIETVFADKGYDAEHHRDLCRRFEVEPRIHKRGQPHGSGLGARRWPVERSNAWVLENKRLALRYDRRGFIVQSLLQAACIFLVAGRLAQEL